MVTPVGPRMGLLPTRIPIHTSTRADVSPELREELSGHDFKSSTDTEVLAHWIGRHYDRLREQGFAGRNDSDGAPLLTRAVMNALREVIGTYGIAVISTEHPDLMVGARRGSPLIVGVGNGENFLASDANAVASHTRQVVYLSDQDVVTLTPDQFNLVRLDSNPAEFQISQLEFHPEDAELGEFAHYMLKEIFEQPRTVQNTMRGRIAHDDATARFGGLNMTTAELRAIERIVMPACGTSWHSALIGEFLFEALAHLPAEGRS